MFKIGKKYKSDYRTHTTTSIWVCSHWDGRVGRLFCLKEGELGLKEGTTWHINNVNHENWYEVRDKNINHLPSWF